MSIKHLSHHYSMENPASVYDEEAMTALELAGRTTAKVNECVDAVNAHAKEIVTHLEEQDETIGNAVKYMKDNLQEYTRDELHNIKENGELAEIITGTVFTDFNHRTENMVTPEMFGAVGDGVTDDTIAFQEAVNTGKTVYLGNKTYALYMGVILPVGASIIGSRNSVVWACGGGTLFLITEKNTISGFTIRVKSADLQYVFLARGDSGGSNSPGDGSLLYTTISNMMVYRDVTEDNDKYTVFHFYSHDNSFYGINVIGCTCVNNGTCGYLARVYSQGEGWVSTCSFINCTSVGFKWHYFFAKSDKDPRSDSGGCHYITNCTGQCTPDTHGFTFMPSIYSAKIRGCMPWDWGSSTTGSKTCKGRPYIFDKEIVKDYSWDAYTNDISLEMIGTYDGFDFGSFEYDATKGLVVGAKYSPHLIPKYIGLPMAPCVKLLTHTPGANKRVRFFYCDNRGVTEVSIYPTEQKAVLSQPLSGIRFGVSADGREVYMFKEGGNIPSNAGIITLPVSNTMIRFGEGNTNNTELTPDIWKDPTTYFMGYVPEDITVITPTVKNNAYVQDANGLTYRLTVVTQDDGSLGLAISQAGDTPKENA